MQHPQKISEAGEVRLLQRDAGGETLRYSPNRLRLCPADSPRLRYQVGFLYHLRRFIDQDRWTDLTDRSIETWLAKERSHGVHTGYREPEETKQEMGCMHASFRGAMSRTA